jgi:hypothetical protein
MIVVKHRVNNVLDLKNLHSQFGVEVDLRSNNGVLVVSHDPIKNNHYHLFNNWIKSYRHNLLIINVKEDGLENMILETINKFNIKNYFFLDQAMPTIIKEKNIQVRSSARISKFESIETIKLLGKKIKWLWIDYYNSKWINDLNEILELKRKYNYKICLVSPELHNHNKKTTLNFKKKLESNLINIDAVCTKYIDLWN